MCAETYIEEDFEDKVNRCYNIMKDFIRDANIESRDTLDSLFGERFNKQERYKARFLLMQDPDIHTFSAKIAGQFRTLYKYGSNFTPEEKDEYIRGNKLKLP
jgi:hypothetical protein